MAIKMISVKQLMFVLKLFQVSAGSIHCFVIRKETLRFMYPKYLVLDMIQRTHLRFWILAKKRNIRFRIKIRIWIVVKETSPN